MMPLLVAVVAGLAAFAITRHARCGGREDGLDRLQDVSFLTRELGLNADQARQIETLHTTLGAKLDDCCARHCAARAGLGETLSGDSDEGLRAEAILSEMCRAYEASERSTLDHMRRVRAILTAEQKKRFDAMITRCMCRKCGTHGRLLENR